MLSSNKIKLNRPPSLAGLLSVALLIVGCQAPAPYVQGRDTAKSANSAHSMAVAAHPLATEAATDILAAGGNAADAAVAAGFVIAVVEPTMNSIGGRSQILIRTSDGTYQAYNGMTEIPAAYVQPEEAPANGYGVIATPGVVAALARLHKEHGSMAWSQLLQPAIRAAKEGFFLLEGEANRHSNAIDAIADNPGFQQSLLKPGGLPHSPGEKLVQAQLAATLTTLAEEGAESFYAGSIARRIADDMASNNGFVTLSDLNSYEVLDGRYISIPYRDVVIHTIAAPAGGGLIAKTLNILSNFELSQMNEAQWAGVISQALGIAVESMGADYYETDLAVLTDVSWGREQAKRVQIPQTTLSSTTSSDRTQEVENLLERQLAVNSATDWSGDSWGTDSHHTTHFATADCRGAVVSITQTNGPSFGSKVITPGLGFVYASTMGSYLSTSQQTPGSRPRTTIAPTVVTRDGEVQLVLGAAGGLRILSAIVQTISRYVDQQLALDAAIAAPRVHPSLVVDAETGQRSADLQSFYAETTPINGWSQAQISALEAAGFSVETNERYGAFGRVHALEKQNGNWFGVADLDWEGTAQGVSAGRCQIR